MELATNLRELWRLRVLVGVVAILALLAGLAVAFRLPSLESRKYAIGVATAKILVDTPNSQVVEVAPKGSDTLGVRANLIANLMADGDVKTAIARRAGIHPEQLVGISELTPGGPPADAAPSPAQGHVLTTRVIVTPEGDRLPIIEVDVQAPDARGAARLAEATMAGLRDYLDSKAATAQVANAQRLRVSGLGRAQAREVVRGPSLLFAFGAGILVFGAGCIALLVGADVARSWRAASADEQLEAGAPAYEEEFDEPSDDEPFDQAAGRPDSAGDSSVVWGGWPEHAVVPPSPGESDNGHSVVDDNGHSVVDAEAPRRRRV